MSNLTSDNINSFAVREMISLLVSLGFFCAALDKHQFALTALFSAHFNLVHLQMFIEVLSLTPAVVAFGEVDLEHFETIMAQDVLGVIVALLEVVDHIIVD